LLVPCIRDLLTVGLGEDLVGGLGPGEGVGAVVPAIDEGADLGVEVFGAGVGAAVDGLAFGQGNQHSTCGARLLSGLDGLAGWIIPE